MYTVGNPILTLDKVSLTLGGKQILKDISFQINDIIGTERVLGQVCTVLGPSGIGKSQLFRIISGLIKPTAGTILIQDHPPKIGEIGFVFQDYPLFTHRTLYSNLKLVSKDTERIEYYLNEFKLKDHQHKYPSQMSGGQRQRSAIIQQILCSSTILVLDEPFSGLDPVATRRLCENISKVANLDSNNTVLISSHILEPSLAISDKVVMIGKTDEGAVIKKEHDLASMGLAWNPDIYKMKEFHDFCTQVRDEFELL